MEQTPLGDLAFQVRHRLIDYLKAAKLHLNEADPADIRTTCPCCGHMALVLEALPGTPMPTWECGFCGKKGNTIDYAQAYFGMTEKKAIIDVLPEKQGRPKVSAPFRDHHPSETARVTTG